MPGKSLNPHLSWLPGVLCWIIAMPCPCSSHVGLPAPAHFRDFQANHRFQTAFPSWHIGCSLPLSPGKQITLCLYPPGLCTGLVGYLAPPAHLTQSSHPPPQCQPQIPAPSEGINRQSKHGFVPPRQASCRDF